MPTCHGDYATVIAFVLEQIDMPAVRSTDQ